MNVVRMTYLRIEKVKDDGGGDQETGPYVDGFDTHVSSVGTDHVGDTPVENDAAELLVRGHIGMMEETYKPRP
jgi:hypothetical protein